MAQQKFLIVIAGPTASGKTSVSIELARHYHSEILSVDSRQFYRELNIGTAKPSPEELEAVPHHFINSLNIHESYSVGDYMRDALVLLDQLFQKHQLVLLTGGSGLYIRALCQGLDEFPKVPAAIREALDTAYREKGITYLQDQLAALDPVYYEKVDLQNPQRLIRALGVCRASGKAYSSFTSGQKAKRPFTPVYIALKPDREQLYQRINRRVDQMLEAGLLEEARGLYPFRELNALQTVGYQELFEYMDKKHSLEEAVELIKRNSRRYAKRQLTWLRKEEKWTSFVSSQTGEIRQFIDAASGG